MFKKKLICVLLSVIMMITAFPITYAYDNSTENSVEKQETISETTDSTTEQQPEQTEEDVQTSVIQEETTETVVEESSEESTEKIIEETEETVSETYETAVFSAKQSNTEIVALLSVVTRVEGIGHAWIYVENISNKTLQVGHYSLPPNQGVSVGLFSFTCEDGIGIYYNVEAYCCNVHGGNGLVSITTDLDMDEMNTLSKKINNYLNHWDPFFNCMYFAFSMWNSVSDRKLIPPVIPALGQLQLRMRGGTENNLQMYCPTPNQVFRLKGRGSNKHLVSVSPESIDQPIGGPA